MRDKTATILILLLSFAFFFLIFKYQNLLLELPKLNSFQIAPFFQNQKNFLKATTIPSLFLALFLLLKNTLDTLSAITSFGNKTLSAKKVFFLFLPIVGRNKMIPWGVVYDAVTKLPIDPALVTLTTDDQRFSEIKETRVTDINGRFSFFVNAGRYTITAAKTNYIFPSKIILSTEDGKFGKIYRGEIIEVEKPYIFNLNIPMDPVKFDWNQSVKSSKHKILDFNKKRGEMILVSAGILIAAASYLSLGDYLSLTILFIFLSNFLFLSTYSTKKLWGYVYSGSTNEKIPRVKITAVREPYNIIMATTNTDYLGRYFLLLAKGQYSLTLQSEKGEFLKNIDDIKVEKENEIINFDIGI